MSTGGSSSGSDSNSKSHHSASSSSPLPPSFHLLEVTLISAQDLYPASCWMKSYAVAWVHPDRKLRTRTDPSGGTDPTWNDKFVFCVDDSFLRSDTSSVTVDIFAASPLARDALVGTARVVISSLGGGPRFVALQVRRPKSLRPQGIINVGVALVDDYIHRMAPMMHDSDGSSAFALKDLANSPMVMSRVSGDSRGRTRSSNSYGSSGDLEERRRQRRRRIDRKDSENVVGNELKMKREAEELESKLEKWRIELSPEQDKDGMGSRRPRRLCRSLSCFGCG